MAGAKREETWQQTAYIVAHLRAVHGDKQAGVDKYNPLKQAKRRSEYIVPLGEDISFLRPLFEKALGIKRKDDG